MARRRRKKNSKYFCNLENRSWQKKTISSLQDAEGNITSDPDKIIKEIQSFTLNYILILIVFRI